MKAKFSWIKFPFVTLLFFITFTFAFLMNNSWAIELPHQNFIESLDRRERALLSLFFKSVTENSELEDWSNASISELGRLNGQYRDKQRYTWLNLIWKKFNPVTSLMLYMNQSNSKQINLNKVKEALHSVVSSSRGERGMSPTTYFVTTRIGWGGHGKSTREKVSLSWEIQELIEQAFLNPAPLTEIDIELNKTYNLKESEIKELKALRLATKIFEANTYLKDDEGSWNGNVNPFSYKIKGAPGNFTTCGDEARTYHDFLSKLGNLKLIKHLSAHTHITRFNHVANLVILERTEEEFVLDSWHEDGGTAAHLVTKQDWEDGNDFNDIVKVAPY